MKSLRVVPHLVLTLCFSPVFCKAQSPPVPLPLVERVNLATHVFVGRAKRLRVRKLVGGRLFKVNAEPASTGINTGLVFELEVIVEEVLFPNKWKPSKMIKIIYGGGAFSIADSRKAFLAGEFVYLTRAASFGGQTYFVPSYALSLVEELSKKEEVLAVLRKRAA